MLVTSAGLGMVFVPLQLVALSRVRGEDSGVAASLLNTGEQAGGAIGLATLGTVTWTAVSNNIKHRLPAVTAGGSPPAAVLHQALAAGVSRGFLLAAGIAARALLTVVTMIRVRRSDLTGAQEPSAAPGR